MKHERIFLGKLYINLGGWLGNTHRYLFSDCSVGVFNRGRFVRTDWFNSRVFDLGRVSMSTKSKKEALYWLISNVKQWPVVGVGTLPKTLDATFWHYDLTLKSWLLYVSVSESESAFISQGEWAIEKGRIAAEKRQVINERFRKKMKDNDYFRWNGYIPNKLEAKAAMANLAAKLRGENDDRFND